MLKAESTYPVVIVGGGPVGLFLGLCLQQAGIPCRILEKRGAPTEFSRSIGIHPPALELLDKLGVADRLISEGVKIKHGHAFSNTDKIGSLSFEQCPKPFNFILSLPQNRTEAILETVLREHGHSILTRNAEVVDFSKTDNSLTIQYRHQELRGLSAKFIIACDGKNSFVRRQAGIPFDGSPYPDTYAMGDFEDNTEFKNDAAVFLCSEGLIESFPLPDNRRRWVVKTEQYHKTGQRSIIEKAVDKRIGHSLSNSRDFMLSSFGVQKLSASRMVKNNIILAGDAAHIVSPIGGQGMNLGWLGAWDLAECLENILRKNYQPADIWPAFEKRRQKALRNSIKRSELNMRLGRKVQFPALRNGIVSLMLNTSLSAFMAKLFTMRGIERWMI